MKSGSLFLFTVFILINLSSGKLNLFRPFAAGRRVKSAGADSDLEPDKLSKLQPIEEQQSAEQPNRTKPAEQSNKEPADDMQLSLGQFLSRKISQAINEIEMKLEDQLMSNNVNESQFASPDAPNELEPAAAERQAAAEHREPVRPAGAGNEIGSSNGEIDGNQLASNNESNSTESSKVTSRPDESTFDRTTSNSTSTPPSVTTVDRALGEATTELSVKELTGLRSTFRTFSAIIDFFTTIFDEFAEAIVSRAATLLINSFFDRASLFLLGI